eukprot:gene19803-biopygen7010
MDTAPQAPHVSPPQNKQRVTRCRRHCVTSRGKALCRLPWCEQVRRGPKRTHRRSLRSSEESPRVQTPQSGMLDPKRPLRICSHHGSLQTALGRSSKATNSRGNQGTWENNAEGAGGE